MRRTQKCGSGTGPHLTCWPRRQTDEENGQRSSTAGAKGRGGKKGCGWRMARMRLALTPPTNHANALLPAAGDRAPGVLISLEPPMRDMVAEAVSAGFYEHRPFRMRFIAPQVFLGLTTTCWSLFGD